MGEPKEWIEIADFSPGIQADRHGYTGASATANPSNNTFSALGVNGSAVVDDTFGCHADRTGALCPLPKRTAVTQASWAPFASNGNTSPNHFPTGKVGYFTLDARITSYIVSDVHDASDESDALFILFGAFYAPSGDGNYRQVVWGVVMGLDIDVWKVVHYDRYAPSIVPSPALSIMSGNVALTRHITGELDDLGFPRYDIYTTQNTVFFMLSPSRDGTVGDDNTSWATGAIPAAETALTSFTTDTGQTDYPTGIDTTVDTFSGCIGIFPDPLTLTNPPVLTDDWYPRYIGGLVALPGYMAIAHQGRAVMAALLSRGYGDGYNLVLDRVTYSPVYNCSLILDATTPETLQSPPDYESSVAGDDIVAPIGTLASITASELLVVKHGRGGVIMRGDMDNFEAVNLPYIESTYGVVSHGVGTPIGWVYGSRNGVFVWSGGQTSEKLSPQLDGFFWNHAPDLEYAGNQGRFGYWHPWVMVPNDFMHDIVSKSWWKLEDTADTGRNPYSWYDTSALNGKLYALPFKHTPGADPTVYVYDPNVLRESYSWKSQPLVETRERTYSVEAIEITLTTPVPASTPAQTITVTFTGLNERGDQVTSQSQTIALNASAVGGTQVLYAQVINGDGAFVARYIQVRLVVNQNSATQPAPKIHKVRVGVTDRARQRDRGST